MDLLLLWAMLGAAWLIHEIGHYACARWFRMPVRRVCLFHDAGFLSVIQLRFRNTVFALGWLPIGAYSDIDFRRASPRQKLKVLRMGALVNLLVVPALYHLIACLPQFSTELLFAAAANAWVAFENMLPHGNSDGARILKEHPDERTATWCLTAAAAATLLMLLFKICAIPELSFFRAAASGTFAAPWT